MVAKSFNQIEISKSALQHNYKLLKKLSRANTRLLAMVKADAYGHGMLDSARVFQEAGCRDFGVAEIGEAVQLRKSGIDDNIFVFLGFAPGDVPLFFTHEIIPIIYDIESARTLSSEAVTQNKEIDRKSVV